MLNVPVPQLHASLQFLNGPLAGQTIPISKQDTRIGSDPSTNDIVISDLAIQPQHARLLWDNGQVIIQSFNAQNIMMVNHHNVAYVVIQDGDEISLGVSGIRFRFIATTELQKKLSPATDLKHTETTRYLCAAAHLDETFRDYVIKHVVGEEHRAVGESYGVDIVPVVKWCFAARQRAFIRDIVLSGILLFWLLSTFILPFPFSLGHLSSIGNLLLQPFLLIILLLIVLGGLFLLVTVLASLRGPLYVVVSALLFLWFLPFSLLAWIVVAVESGMRYYGSGAARLAKGRFRSDNIEFPLEPGLEQKLRDTFQTLDGNVVVYSGYSPFAGAGFNIGGWSFAVDTSKGKQKVGEGPLSPIPFQVSEIYDYIADAMRDLGLGDLSLEDKLYVNGQEIRDDKRFLDHPFARPYTQIDPSVMKEFIETPSQDIRYYKRIHVTSWRGELVLSIFLRFLKIGKSLFVEANYLLLPPLKEDYYRIDTIEPSLTAKKIWEVAKQTFVHTVYLWLYAPIRVFSWVFRDWLLMRERKRVTRLIEENPAFDYGASTSLREAASSSNYRRYFQKLDKEMYVKIIEREVLDSIINFLETKNIDTTDLKERQETILNNGVIVSGGSFTAENVAVGEQAKAVFSSSTQSAREALGGAKQQTSKN